MFAFGLFLGVGKATVQAEGMLSGDVVMLKRENNNYVMQVTVENKGPDFSGTVQVIFAGSGIGNCAYNTQMSLPAQGKKQFTITVTEHAASETLGGQCSLNFLDEKGNTVDSLTLKNIFGNAQTGFSVGVLSDDYGGLSYLDAGGRVISNQGMNYPLVLLELNGDNLAGYLDGLYFLIIDRINIASLGEENIKAIQEWVEDGGWLMIGTGEYADQTLSGFDEDFIGVESKAVSEAGDENYLSFNADKYYFYYYYTDAGVDFRQMKVAELDYNSLIGSYHESSESGAVCLSVGNGAISVFPFSLGDKELKKLRTNDVLNLYYEVMQYSNSYRRGGNSLMAYTGRYMLSFIDSYNTDVDFTGLELLIAVYVVLVGPVLYLIFRKRKKSEWYWVGVPLFGFLFSLGVFLFGQGARVNETKVYSVTAQRVDSSREDTYFMMYHSGVKPWSVRLNDGYDAAGPGWDVYYNSYNSNTQDYYYMLGNDSEGLSVGIKPRENFENAFLYAGGRADSKGSITCEGVGGTGLNGNITGTVRNDTNSDFVYMAVWFDSCLMVFSDVRAGETLDLQQAVTAGRCVLQDVVSVRDGLGYSGYIRNRSNVYKQDDMAALMAGLCVAGEASPTDRDYVITAGVVKNYDKAVTSKCSEISYGCLYSYTERGTGQNAAY